MCGIAGIWNFDGRAVGAAAIDRFTDSLAHRGPDGRGTWRDDRAGVALGHRRLSIIDLSEAGHQPMGYADARYWITFNGEIYNFLELRAELEARGYEFRSSSDTEVILAAYAQWGAAMLERFNGMWALAIYDKANRTIFLARDRFGIKPLHYILTRSGLAFASELKAFRALDGYKPEPDTETASVLLGNSFAVEATQRTLFKNVRRLQGGHCALIGADGAIKLTRWWNTLDHLQEVPQGLKAQAGHFRELFHDAVRLRMRSDVPVGSCLSGGFDSSAIVCTLAELGRNSSSRMAHDWQQTFIATFPGMFYDESRAAEKVVKYAHVKGHYLPITDAEALFDVNRVLGDFDDVFFGMPTAAWLIYRELRRSGVVVSLDGHGADELMGGYAQADKLLFHDAPSLLFSPGDNRARIARYRDVISHFVQTPPEGKILSPLKALLAHHPSFKALRQLKSLRQKAAYFSRAILGLKHDFLLPAPVPVDMQLLGMRDELPKHWGPFTRSLYPMFHSTVLPTILRNFDRVSMAHGVEVRSPFLDWRLVCYVFSLPDEAKLAQGLSKLVAREAMRDRMPEDIRTEQIKIGFTSQLPSWLNGPLKGWVHDLIPKDNQHPLIDIAAFRRHVEATTAARGWSWQNSEHAWLLLNYLWFERELTSR